MRALIFGINGQDGWYLNNLLTQQGIEVTGVSRSAGNWITGSVTDRQFVNQIIQKIQPDYIFHLAANSTTAHHALFENHDTISTGTLCILESAFSHAPHAKIFLSGSAMQFQNRGIPIDEQTPFEALNAYAIARIQSVYAARYYRTKGLQVYVGYFFNHESPLRTPKHVSRMITDAVKRIANGSTEKIEIGNANVQKEWNFAGDFAHAILTLVKQPLVFEAVIGSGKAYSIAEWLHICFDMVKLNWQDHVLIKNDFKPEYELLVSNPSLLNSLNYKPQTSFEQLAQLMMK
jgi:GDPmannose 4,6-dehydratase